METMIAHRKIKLDFDHKVLPEMLHYMFSRKIMFFREVKFQEQVTVAFHSFDSKKNLKIDTPYSIVSISIWQFHEQTEDEMPYTLPTK